MDGSGLEPDGNGSPARHWQTCAAHRKHLAPRPPGRTQRSASRRGPVRAGFGLHGAARFVGRNVRFYPSLDIIRTPAHRAHTVSCLPRESVLSNPRIQGATADFQPRADILRSQDFSHRQQPFVAFGMKAWISLQERPAKGIRRLFELGGVQGRGDRNSYRTRSRSRQTFSTAVSVMLPSTSATMVHPALRVVASFRVGLMPQSQSTLSVRTIQPSRVKF